MVTKMTKDSNAVSQVFGILLMVVVVVILTAVIAIYSFDIGNNKLEKSGYGQYTVTDTIYRIQYDPDCVSVFLTHHYNDSIIYRVSNKEKKLIEKLEKSYESEMPIEIYYTRIGWLYQISNVEYVQK